MNDFLIKLFFNRIRLMSFFYFLYTFLGTFFTRLVRTCLFYLLPRGLFLSLKLRSDNLDLGALVGSLHVDFLHTDAMIIS